MNPFMKISIIRGGSILLVAIEIILFVGNNAHAQFMKKLAIEPPVNPNGWERTFKLGIAFSLMLEDSLNESGQFQVVRPSKKLKRARNSNLLGNSDDMSQGEIVLDSVAKQMSIRQTPPSLYRFRGCILFFDPDTNPLKENYTESY